MGFALPCEVRVFNDNETSDAQEWITEPLPTSGLSFELLRETSILILRPSGELEAGDFERVAAEIDPFIEETGGLRGLMVEAESFPGWENFSALASHLRFVKEHHKKIQRVALVSDGRLASMAPSLMRHFITAEVRHFAFDQKDQALHWLRQVRGDHV